MRRPAVILLLLLLAGLAAGAWWYLHLRAPARPTEASFADLPGWSAGEPAPALAAFRRSCTRPLPPPWHAACRQAATAEDARRFFESAFTPWRIGDGLVTGYYEPLLRGSATRHGAYQTPVYGLPDDLVTVDLGLFRPALQGQHVTGRLQGHRLLPYPARAAIDAHPPAARVLFWGDDPVSVFFLHVQGSGRVQLDDGRVLRVGYAGQNGRPYTAIGRTLIAQGALTRQAVSMQAIRAWLVAHPAQARGVMRSDASYVFFQDTPVGDPSLGAQGTQGVPLTPRGSAAVDPAAHTFGTPVFVVGQGLFIAQDTGGAIRGPARADIFFGFGPAAEDAAGRLKGQTTFYVLLPKGVAP